MRILDAGNYYWEPGKDTPTWFPVGRGLLDGRGGILARDRDPVYLDIPQQNLLAGTAQNSAGEYFDRPAPVYAN
jgi:hypothetical protein